MFDEHKSDIKRFFQQPIDSTLLGFSKVTNMFLGAVGSSATTAVNEDELTKSLISSRKSQLQENTEESISTMLDSLNTDNIHTTNNEGFEVVTRVDLGPMPIVVRSMPVQEKDIEYDQEGRVLRSKELKEKIFRGVSVCECVQQFLLLILIFDFSRLIWQQDVNYGNFYLIVMIGIQLKR